jgi:hypothetical protein
MTAISVLLTVSNGDEATINNIVMLGVMKACQLVQKT